MGLAVVWFLLRTVRENPPHASPQASRGLLAVLGVRRLVDASAIGLCLHLHAVFSIRVHVCVQISPFYEDTGHTGPGAHPAPVHRPHS